MLPSETMIWQPEFTDKTLSRKPGAVHLSRPLYLIPHLVSLPDLRAQNRPYHYSRESKPC
ncbi:hypothetical protein AW109_25180 [Escherichia coli]|nr:hypothetical protein AW109_25180 [Escherichia coli]